MYVTSDRICFSQDHLLMAKKRENNTQKMVRVQFQVGWGLEFWVELLLWWNTHQVGEWEGCWGALGSRPGVVSSCQPHHPTVTQIDVTPLERVLFGDFIFPLLTSSHHIQQWRDKFTYILGLNSFMQHNVKTSTYSVWQPRSSHILWRWLVLPQRLKLEQPKHSQKGQHFA